MKILFLAALFAFHPAQPGALEPVLTTYYQVKDALFLGDAPAAAKAAGELLKTINGIDTKTLSPKDQQAFLAFQNRLAYDSRHISESSDISHQREHFVVLSANMISLAKRTRLSQQPIYEDYCPMKKACWLSADLTINNPFFGSIMPGCGKISSTIRN